MSTFWRTIEVEVEPRNKSFRIGVDLTTTVEEILEAIVAKCEKEPDLNLDKWAQKKVGSQHNFILIRKGTGHSEINPGLTLGELTPDLENGEVFKFDVRPTVGRCKT